MMVNEDRRYPPPTPARGPSFSFALQPGSHPIPSLSAQSDPHLTAHAHEQQPQTPPVNVNQSTSLPFTLPVHHPPGQFASNPLHTPYNIFPVQYVMSTHPPLHQNQPPQTHAYHGYRPLGPGQYSPTQYFPLSRHQPQPYAPHPFSLRGSNTSYRPQHLPPPIPQFATGSPGPSHPGSYGGVQQYMPHAYGTAGHYGSLQHYQPTMYQWYPASADMFIEGDPAQLQQHPIIPSQPPSQRPYRDFNMARRQSTASEQLPSPSQGPSSSSASVAASGRTVSSATGGSPELVSAKMLPKADLRPSPQPSAGTSRMQDRPPIRRYYHPNPPPNRSEWVMWVGNIPNDATHDELWRFLKQSFPTSTSPRGVVGVKNSGVLSVFLISRSNCAFVNYHTEEQLNRAITQFNGRKLRPHDRSCPRLVCRARRKEDDLQAGVGAQRGMGVHTRYVENVLRKGKEPSREEAAPPADGRPGPSETREPPLVPSVSKEEETPKPDTTEGTNQKVPTHSPGSYASTSSSFLSRYFPKRFFILKSLSRYDLDLSTKRGVWATQKHNESILDQAYRTSKEAILIFSVNKSGEFYGYARMTSGISRGNRSISWAQRADSSSSTSPPSTNHVPSGGSPEQLEHQLRQAQNQKYTPPSERLSFEVTPFPSAPSPDEANEDLSAATMSRVKSAQQLPQSASPVLDCDGDELSNPDQPLRSNFSANRQGRLQLSQTPDPIPTQRSEPRKYSGVRTGARGKSGGGAEDSGNLGSRLPPVMEERHTENGGVEEDPPAQPTMLPASTHGGRLEGQERDASWGEAFMVEWLCVDRVSFHRTRHLRNPWNHGREIKVSRDGTELEPSVGQQLIDSWSYLAGELAGARHTGAGVGKRGGRPSTAAKLGEGSS